MPYYICVQGNISYSAATELELECPTCGRRAVECRAGEAPPEGPPAAGPVEPDDLAA